MCQVYKLQRTGHSFSNLSYSLTKSILILIKEIETYR